MTEFWDCIKLSDKVEAYKILADQYMLDTGELLPGPGMSGEETERQPPIINAQDFEEEEEISIASEMSKAPSHPKRIG